MPPLRYALLITGVLAAAALTVAVAAAGQKSGLAVPAGLIGVALLGAALALRFVRR